MQDDLPTPIPDNHLPGLPLEQGLTFNQPPHPYRPEPKVRLILLVQLLLFILFLLLGWLLFQLISAVAGWDSSNVLLGKLSADAPPSERWQMRLFLGLSSPLPFVAAGLATAWIFYRRVSAGFPGWRDYLAMRHWPSPGRVGQACLLLLVAMPLVLFLLMVSKLLPMPELFHSMEESTNEMLKGLLQMDSIWELLANLLLIALLPALGEELVFRGVLQQQLMRRIANPWVAIVVTATIFSAIHGQFEGFLSRLLLGFLLGWLYWRTRNLWVAVAAHFFNNGLQVVGQYLFHREISTVDLEEDVQVPWFAALLSALLVIGVMRWIDRQREAGEQVEIINNQEVK